MSSKLYKYSKQSEIMDITIINGKESFDFNLFRELQINEKESEIKQQPAIYGFLTTLHRNLIKAVALAKVAQKKSYASAYLKNKVKIGPGGRPFSDDMAHSKAELDKRFIRKQKLMIELEFDLGRVESAVKSFEQRASLLQTLSANNRKQI